MGSAAASAPPGMETWALLLQALAFMIFHDCFCALTIREKWLGPLQHLSGHRPTKGRQKVRPDLDTERRAKTENRSWPSLLTRKQTYHCKSVLYVVHSWTMNIFPNGGLHQAATTPATVDRWVANPRRSAAAPGARATWMDVVQKTPRKEESKK